MARCGRAQLLHVADVPRGLRRKGHRDVDDIEHLTRNQIRAGDGLLVEVDQNGPAEVDVPVADLKNASKVRINACKNKVEIFKVINFVL